MNNQIILGLLSEAGGVGKTTLAVNIAYDWVTRGRSAVILDLDSNHSLEDFIGLPPNQVPISTIVKVFDQNFDGRWPLVAPLEEEKLQVCQGHILMSEVLEKLVTRKRREYVLKKLLTEYPLPHELVILDCSAGLDLMFLNVLAASTHILIPLDMGVKVKTAARLIQTILLFISELELNPAPQILGFIPNRYNKGASVHEDFLAELPQIAQALEVKLYPPIRIWQHLNNSAVYGLPLKKLRPGDPVGKIFGLVANDLEILLKK
jgi:chromosome partitioning protein